MAEEEEIRWAQAPEYEKQMGLFEDIQEPWMKDQYQMYQDIFEPQMRQLGGVLGQQLEQPLSLPEDVWNKVWQKGRERIAGQYEPLRQQGTERAAGRGMLGQGPSEKYSQSLDLSYGKSMEDLATDMVIQEWTEKKAAKQQSIANMQTFMGYQPQFNLPMPQSTSYLVGGDEEDQDYGGMGTILGAGALGALSLAVPGTGIGLAGLTGMEMAGIGGLLGGGIGSMF